MVLLGTSDDWLELRVGLAVELEHDAENSEGVGGAVAVGDGVAQVGPVLGVVVNKVELQGIGNLN